MRNIDDDAAQTATATTETAPATETPPLTDRISDVAQNVVKALIGSNRPAPRRLKSLLHGTPFGHPLHPAITDIPIGAWVVAAILDIIWLVSSANNEWAARAAVVVVLVGVVAALGAITTGLSDWSDTYGAERTIGLYHGSINSLATILYIVSVVLRFQSATSESVAGAIVGFVGLATVLVGGYLGGEMSFGKGTGINHTAWEAAGEDYEAVLPVNEVPEHGLKRVVVAGVPVVLLKLGDRYCAISATCSHAGGPLDEGELQGDVVQCPWHGSRFSMRNGKALTGPATFPQPRYDVRVRDGQIELKRL